MNDFFKKLFTRIAGLWANWTNQQRGILVGVAAVIFVGLIALFTVLSSPGLVSVMDFSIRDEVVLDRIVARINQEDVCVTVSANGLVQVQDEVTARRIRGILITESLIPDGIAPWQVFNRDRWTYTDFERNVNLQRVQRQMIVEHINALDDVDHAEVTIAWPSSGILLRHPITATVIITPRHGSDILHNRRNIEGIQRLVSLSILGLLDENIAIVDNRGNLLNDFTSMWRLDEVILPQIVWEQGRSCWIIEEFPFGRGK